MEGKREERRKERERRGGREMEDVRDKVEGFAWALQVKSVLIL